MSSGTMPVAEVEIDEALVRRLLAAQFPDLVQQELRRFACGWDNEIYRLGDRLGVRLPRRAVAAELIRNEQRWLPRLAPGLPLPISVPVRAGRPSSGYPWPWNVCEWIDGDNAGRTPPADANRAAETLGAFLAALHRAAPADAPHNEVRGGPLRTRAESTLARFARLEDELELAPLRRHWEAALAAPESEGPACWLQGDLHPANLLVRDGEIAAVIDFGDLCAGDRATDLSVAWMLFDAGARRRFRERAGAALAIDDATWIRARGWAVVLALAFLAHSSDNPTMRGIGERTARALVEDAGG